jgi:exonuclease VII small subunit
MTDETKTEEVVAVDETADLAEDVIEKAVTISEVEDTLDFTKMVGDLKTLFTDSLQKSSSEQAQAVESITKMVGEIQTEVTRVITDLTDKHAEIQKSVDEMNSKVENLDSSLKGFESATAIKKSSDFNGSMEEKTIQKREKLFDGVFLGSSRLTRI